MKITLNWSVYIICCSDDSLYTGISIDIVRRFDQHLNMQGARYFRGRQPKALVYIETGHSRRTASQREIAIKKMRRVEKLQLIASVANDSIIERISVNV
jgi:putative endonuclease